MRKNIFIFFLIFTLSIIFTFCKKSDAPKEIILGGIFDLSGPTSDVGIEYADGVKDYIKYVNKKGGINGRKIKLVWKDYAYKISQAYLWYDELKINKIIAIIGWGTGDTEALAPKVNDDKIPFISASYSEKIANGKDYPYNFIGSVSYSDQARIALKYIQNRDENAKVAFIYNDTGFGRSPFFPDATNFAKEINLNISEKIIVPLSGKGAEINLRNMKADWAIVQETATATIAIIQAIKKLNLKTKLIVLNWGLDENALKKINTSTEGVFVTIPYAVWDDVMMPGVKLLHEINKEFNSEKKERTCRYIQGYINTRIMLEAVKNSGDDLRSERIKDELENLKNFNTGASYADVTFSEFIHKPNSSLKIYSIKNGKFVAETPMLISIEQKIWSEY